MFELSVALEASTGLFPSFLAENISLVSRREASNLRVRLHFMSSIRDRQHPALPCRRAQTVPWAYPPPASPPSLCPQRSCTQLIDSECLVGNRKENPIYVESWDIIHIDGLQEATIILKASDEPLHAGDYLFLSVDSS